VVVVVATTTTATTATAAAVAYWLAPTLFPIWHAVRRPSCAVLPPPLPPTLAFVR